MRPFFVVGVDPAAALDVDAMAGVALESVVWTIAARLYKKLSVLVVINVNPRSALDGVDDAHGDVLSGVASEK